MDLEDLRTRTNTPEMDALDTQLFGEALNPLQTSEQVRNVRAEIRRTCEFCPTAKRVGEIVASVIGKRQELESGHLEECRRIVSASDAEQQESELRQITGISAEQAAQNREKARQLIAKLSETKPVKRQSRFGEVPDFLKPEFDDLAQKRRELDQRFPAMAAEGK